MQKDQYINDLNAELLDQQISDLHLRREVIDEKIRDLQEQREILIGARAVTPSFSTPTKLPIPKVSKKPGRPPGSPRWPGSGRKKKMDTDHAPMPILSPPDRPIMEFSVQAAACEENQD